MILFYRPTQLVGFNNVCSLRLGCRVGDLLGKVGGYGWTRRTDRRLQTSSGWCSFDLRQADSPLPYSPLSRQRITTISGHNADSNNKSKRTTLNVLVSTTYSFSYFGFLYRAYCGGERVLSSHASAAASPAPSSSTKAILSALRKYQSAAHEGGSTTAQRQRWTAAAFLSLAVYEVEARLSLCR